MATALRIPPKTNAEAEAATEALQNASTPAANSVTVEAGTDGLAAGDLQTVLQSLATRIAELEAAA